MKEILMLQGIPASGKSTFARSLAANHPKRCVIVNRDSIRTGLGNYWVPEREPLVTAIEEYMVKESLRQGYSVIIDATNLRADSINKWKEIAKQEDVGFGIVRFIVPLRKAIRRDLWRRLLGKRHVGAAVIRKFYKRQQELMKEN